MDDMELSAEVSRDGAQRLAAAAEVVYVATNGAHGHPNVRPMAPARVEGVETIWFITHIESSKIIELIKDSHASLCGVSPCGKKSFRLWGDVDILDDRASREHVWSGKCAEHFAGADDPNMRVLKFSVVSGMYEEDGSSGVFSN